MRYLNPRSPGVIVFLACLLQVALGIQARAAELSLTKTPFGSIRDGQAADLFTMTNTKGFTAKVTNYGAIIVELDVPDKNGKAANIIQTFKSAGDYESKGNVNGATIGRYANRISNAKFSIDGKEYSVTRNGGQHSIHGGKKAFHRVMWKAQEVRSDKSVGVILSYRSVDGEEGFPGNLDVTVTYTVPADANELHIEYNATTDKPTVVNLTNHGYFNLAGAGSGRIDNHIVTIHAKNYAPAIDLIPTGEIKPLAGTPLDFSKPTTVGSRLKQVKNLYDHTYVIEGGGKGQVVLAARVEEPNSGRVMEFWSTQPTVQLYTGDGKAICIEPGLFPDTPNRPEFPTAVVRPGGKYHQIIEYHFSTQ